MNCERIQELIWTDYSDGQMSAVETKRIDDHLAHCAACRSLAQEVRQTITVPLAQLPAQKVDESIWRNLRCKIGEEQTEPELGISPIDILKNFIFTFKPALVTACVFLFVGAAVFTTYQTPKVVVAKGSPASQGEFYLSYVSGAETQSSDAVTSGIEKYFL